jgi:membrane-bound lytic murein transglycosylase D
LALCALFGSGLLACSSTPEREPWQASSVVPAGPSADAATAGAEPDPSQAASAPQTSGGAPTANNLRPAAYAPPSTSAPGAIRNPLDALAGAAVSPTAGGDRGIAPAVRPDLLARVRAGFQLPDPNRAPIDTQLNFYARNPDYVERVFGRAELYLYHIVSEVERRGMPLELALLPVIESAFEPYAYSSSRASGLWQFIPGTGQRFGMPQNWWYDGRRDVLESTRAALDYLQFLHDEFDGDWLLAVAGYNCGENCVARAVRANLAAGRPTDFWSLKLPTETRAYVPKLLAMKRLIARPEGYGLAISGIPNEPYFVRVDVDGQIDLKLAAELAGISSEELFELNAAYHRWATPPNGPHHLLLPLDSADLFRENYALLTPDERMRVTHHVVRRGETLAAVSQRYGATPLHVRMLNGLGEGALVEGTDLRIPIASQQLPPKVMRAAARVDGGQQRRTTRRPVVHVVRRGDSLWSIAQRNNMDTRTLMSLNNIAPGQTLRPGERLVVSKSGGSARSKSRSASSSSASGSTRSIKHTVRKGDTLYRIAQIYQVTISQIASWNDISTSATLRPGQKLNINVGVRR